MPKTAAHQEAVGGTVVLGKLEKKDDERNLKLANYIDTDVLIPEVPSRARWSRAVKKSGFPMYRNDKLPDCTCAAVGHAERVFSYNAGSPEDPTEDEVLALFDATGTRRSGRYSLDILNFWRNQGFGEEQEKIFVYAEVNAKDRKEVEAAIWLFGGVYAGIALPMSAQRQKRWSVVRGDDGQPGSWGGHAVWMPDFTKMRGPVCITWGTLMEMTWGFWRTYADEAYAVLSPDWADGQREAPNGFNLDKLKEDLASIAG